MFIPVWQDQTSLLFGDLRGTFTTSPTQEGNFGLGYRTQVSPDWILGGYGYLDIQNSRNDNLFYQGSVGAEALSVDWDLRLNGYFPFNSGGQSAGGNGKLEISGTHIGITHDMEKPLFGFDGEVGWRLPIVPADGDIDVRAFVGGYYFTNSDVDTVAGPRGRLEVRLYDIDVLGVQSRLTVDGEVQWDSPRGTQGFGGLELRIPLGAVTGTPGGKLSPLDRRMVDRVQRDVDIVSQTYESDPKAVVVDGLTGKTHTIVFAENGGTGNGTKGDPTSLEDAPALAAAKGRNAIIVVEGDGGPITLAGQPVQLENGQALLGGDSKVVLHDAGDSGIQATLHAPGERPTILGADSAANLINMYSGGQNRVTGLDLAGSFDNAIFGLNMSRAVVTDNFIDPPAGNGIFLQNSGAAIPASQLAYIARNTIEDAAGDGIAVKSYLSDTLAHTQAVAIIGNTISDAGRDGIQHMVSAIGLASFSDAVTIAGNSIGGIAGPGLAGIGIADTAYLASMPGAVSQRLLIAGNDITDVRVGIRVRHSGFSLGASYLAAAFVGNSVGLASSFGIALIQNLDAISGTVVGHVTMSYNDVASAGTVGMVAGLTARGVGSVSQTIAMEGNSLGTVGGTGIQLSETLLSVSGAAVTTGSIGGNRIASAGGSGIQLGLVGLYLHSLSQTATIDRNSLGTVGGDGIGVVGFTGSIAGAAVTGLSVSDNAIAGAGGDGIHLSLGAQYLGGISQTVAIAHNVVGNAGTNGIQVIEALSAISGTVASGLTLVGNDIGTAGRYGIQLGFTENGAATATLGVTLGGNTVDNAQSRDGIDLFSIVSNVGGAVASTLSVYGNDVGAAQRKGIDLSQWEIGLGALSSMVAIQGNQVGTATSADGIGFTELIQTIAGAASSSLMIAGNQVGTAGYRGINAGVLASRLGSLSSSIAIQDNSVGSAGGSGIRVVETLSRISGPAVSGVSLAGNEVDSAGSDGLVLSLAGFYAASLAQSFVVAGNDIGTAGGNGIATTLFFRGTSVASGLTISGNAVTSAGGDGISATWQGFSLGALSQSIVIDDNNIGAAAQDGIGLSARFWLMPVPVTSSLSIEGNRIASSGRNGIYLLQKATGATVAQSVSVDGNTIAMAGANGLYSRLLAGSGAAITQLGTIDGNVVSGAGSDGVRIGVVADPSGGADLVLGLSGNSVGANAGNGFAGLANGANVTETVTLVSGSGNHFTGNGGAGAYLSNLGVSLTFHIDGNDLSGNSGGTTATAGAVTVTP
jgi:hypothetical protein